MKQKYIVETLRKIRARHGTTPDVTVFNESHIHGILTNKPYLGIREIGKGSADVEEVPAVWKAVVERRLFEEAAFLLEGNRGRFKRPKTSTFEYRLSGRIRLKISAFTGASMRS